MSFGIRLGVGIGMVGLAMMVAPFVVPREAFGELGHGDGMGLIGLSFWGMVLAVAGLVISIVAALASGKQTNHLNSSADEDGGETK